MKGTENATNRGTIKLTPAEDTSAPGGTIGWVTVKVAYTNASGSETVITKNIAVVSAATL